MAKVLCRALVLAGALAIGAAPALALDPSRSLTQYVHEVWRWSPGLGSPFGTVTAIGQTLDGYLLLGTTSDGLVRFDGVRFVRDSEFDQLFGQGPYGINAFAADTTGTLWVATRMGLARLSGGKWTAMARQLDATSLALTTEGDLLVAARQDGLIRWRAGISATLTGEECTSVAAGPAGEIWAGTGGHSSYGLLRIRGGEITKLHKKDGLADDGVADLHFGPSGNLWVAARGGLSRVKNGRIAGLITRRDGLPSDDLTAVFEDHDGSVWMGTGADGIARLREGRVESFGKAQGFPSGAVTAFYEDREGSLWVATRDALSRFKAGHITPFGEAEGLPHDRMTSIVEGGDGSVWIWTDGGGLSQLKNGRVVRVYTTRDGLASNFGGPVFESRDGAIWVGHDRGMSRLKDGRATAYREGPVGQNYIPMITEDAEGILTYVFGMGLARFRDGRVTPYLLKDGSTTERLQMPFAARWARDGTLWLGTSKGAWTLREGVLRKVWDLSSGLAMVAWIHEDAGGAIWLGTWEGLFRLQGGAVAAITTEQGLPDNRINYLIEDGLGYLWMGSAHGIFRVKKQELDEVAAGRRKRVDPEVFGSADGMRIAEVNAAAQPSGCATRDGRLWFATRAGAVVVDPANLRRNRQPPPVAIEGVTVDGRPRGMSPEVRLEAGTTRLDVQYTALSLLAPERVRFKFRLEGLDPDWVDGGGRRVASYTQLPPGAYRFRVIAANNDGVWNETGATISIRHLPYWYETAWFQLVAALGVVASVAGGHAVRTRGLRARERKLQARVEERTTELRREISVREQGERELLAEVAERRKAEAQARESAAFLDSIVENIPAFVYVKDAEDLTFLRLNRPAKEMLGIADRPAEALLGKTDYDFLPREQADAIRAKDREVLAGGRLVEVGEEPITTPQGVRELLTKKMPIMGLDGRPLYLLGISEDITERKRIQGLLERQRDELSRSNAELEQFASIASHDLQEPLRKVRSFGDRLAAALGDSLPEGARGHLARMLAAAERMQALIEDLLTYSHARSRARPLVPVDLDKVVAEVVSDLEGRVEEAGGRIECGPLPRVLADATQMRQLFQNLMANALKFRRPGVPPVVSISARGGEGPQGEDIELEIRDNGIGIEEEFLDRIFAPFERLHPQSEYAGTGIGLAICRKIAERHRGSIVVESRVGEGSVFRVRLPAAGHRALEVPA